jgi:hypothetical protein
MANLVRLVACAAILLGLAGELACGLLLPSRIVVQYAPPPPVRHLVEVNLPTTEQVFPWCRAAQEADQWGQRLYCDIH